MNDKTRFRFYVVVSLLFLFNFWMTCYNTHNINKLQEQYTTDSLRNCPQNVDITIKYVLPRDTVK